MTHGPLPDSQFLLLSLVLDISEQVYVFSYRGFGPLSYYIYRSHWDTGRPPRARGGLVFPETVKNIGVSTIEHVTISKSRA